MALMNLPSHYYAVSIKWKIQKRLAWRWLLIMQKGSMERSKGV